MTIRHLALISAAACLTACSGATDTVKTAASDTVTKVAAELSRSEICLNGYHAN